MTTKIVLRPATSTGGPKGAYTWNKKICKTGSEVLVPTNKKNLKKPTRLVNNATEWRYTPKMACRPNAF